VQAFNSVLNGAALVTKVIEQTTIGQPQLIKTAAADVGTAPSIRVISRIPSIAATKVAKKPESTATTVHKAAAGASSAAAAK
jgi:hypothetical protein